MEKRPTSEIIRLNVNEFKESQKLPLTVVLDNLRSQSNVGSIFRTSDAFRVDSIHLCGITATPPSREIHKTALGATESMDWTHSPETKSVVENLKKDGYFIVGVELADKSISIEDFEPLSGMKYAYIFGNEVHGIDDEVMSLCDLCIEIPQFGTKHSLNVAVSAGIALWEFYKKATMAEGNLFE